MDSDALLVERQLRVGRRTCPSSGAVLAPRGHGRPREIRGDLADRRLPLQLFLRRVSNAGLPA
ncbi:hypothetical protein [Streptomyces sp. NPDC051109]|uniref:hypothetical protein n=1 Tax=Streptomyces sp. NPDC051109 TaxID=3365642 RepID=UPI0037BDD8EC